MKYLILIITLLITTATYSNIFAQGKIYGGFGLGMAGLMVEDPDFNTSRKSVQIPFTDHKIEYYSVGFPIIRYEPADRSFGLEFGLNGISVIHKKQPVNWLSLSRKEKTSFEVTTTTLYADYMVSRFFFDFLRGFIFAGPTIVETVLTEATEVYNVVDNGSGGTKEEFSSTDKNYQIEYNIGATFGLGMSYTFTSLSEVGFQIRHFYRGTGLKLSNGREIVSGSTQVQLIYLMTFD